MGKYDYERHLQSTYWRRFKKTYFKHHDKVCFVCTGTTNITLHHMHYLTIGHENWSDVVPLCGRCHAEIHRRWCEKLDPDAHIILWRDYQYRGLAAFSKPSKRERMAQKQREERAMALQFECPECLAKVGHKCFGKGNEKRRYHHRARINKARSYASRSKTVKTSELTLAQEIAYGLAKKPAGISPNLRLDRF